MDKDLSSFANETQREGHDRGSSEGLQASSYRDRLATGFLKVSFKPKKTERGYTVTYHARPVKRKAEPVSRILFQVIEKATGNVVGETECSSEEKAEVRKGIEEKLNKGLPDEPFKLEEKKVE